MTSREAKSEPSIGPNVDDVIGAIIAKDYVAAIAHLRRLDAREGKWRYRYQYNAAIARIEAVFQQTFVRSPWPKDIHPNFLFQCQNEIGYYCSRLGVAALIDDMRLAAGKYQPDSLLYFIRSHDEHGQELAPRWEQLIYLRMEEEWQETKAREAEADEQAAKKLGLKIQKPIPPWVIEARESRQRLRGKATLTADERRDLKKIESLLDRFGYSDEN